jgi:predicted O-methyltransferase YrrM
MEFINEDIQAYAEKMTQSESELLYELNRYTHTNVLKSRMLSGHLQGRFLSFISKMIQAKCILDIGTYTGYSALCLAEGLAEGGVLYTIDNNEEVMHVAQNTISKSEYAKQIECKLGNAIEIIEGLKQQVPQFDLVWIDADKWNYLNYYHLVIEHMKQGGVIMADNVLWSGKVLDEKALAKDEDTMKLHEFNEIVKNDERVENLLLPIRDGIMMVRKK